MIGMRAVYLDAGSGAAHPVAPAVIRAVRRVVTLPLIVGGGMKSPEQVRAARTAGADLVVVGTAVETGARSGSTHSWRPWRDVIDLHTHLLPGVDDGSHTLEQSVEVLERFAEQG